MTIPLSIILSLLALGWLTYIQVRKVLDRTSAAPSLEAPVAAHRMVRVWINDKCAYHQKGWWYECSCGQKLPDSGVSTRYLGSEAGAINSYKAHAARHKGLAIMATTENPFEKKYTDEVAAYQEYVSKCFCKDTNDDLLVLKNRHLDK